MKICLNDTISLHFEPVHTERISRTIAIPCTSKSRDREAKPYSVTEAARYKSKMMFVHICTILKMQLAAFSILFLSQKLQKY